MDFKNIGEELKNFVEIEPVNLSSEQAEEFRRVYRVLSQDLSNFYDFIKKQKYYEEQNERYVNAMENVIKMIDAQLEEEDNDDLELLRGDLQKQIDKYYETREETKENIEETTKRYERAENFMKEFTQDITFVDGSDSKCRVGERTKFLIEYLHSLGNIVEQEQRSEQDTQQ